VKLLLVSLAILALITAEAIADGTIFPLPGILGRVRFDCNGDGLPDRLATSADGLELHLYYGPEGATGVEELAHFPQFAVIEDTFGRWIGFPTILNLPGTLPGTYATLHFRILTPNGILAETDFRQFMLGPETGPGTIVWSSGTLNDQSRFPYLRGPYPDPSGACVPEPSTIALGAIAGVFLLYRARKSIKSK
jgi:hypothetical protein